VKGNFDFSLKKVLGYEGGFVNNPKDPGGMTNLGVTKAVWENYVNRQVDEAEMRALTPALVTPLYHTRYWDAVRGDDLPAGVDHVVFDCAVNSGPTRAARFLQQVVGTYQDGKIGPATLTAVLTRSKLDLIDEYCDTRVQFLQSLPTYDIFGKGWVNRVNDVRNVGEFLAK
jgi:lysozyme family protein